MIKGLSSHQANQFLKQYGLNIISEQKKKPLYVKFFEQFSNFLTILLLVASLFAILIGEQIDGGLILVIVVLNAAFGLYQELKAEESIAALKKMTISNARVVRDGKEREIDSKYVVSGDVIFIEEGTKVPADGVIIESLNLEANEAALTGESLPVGKKTKDHLYSGTIIVKGRGHFQVTETGMNTKFGKIAKNLSIIQDTKTPLQKKLAELTRMIGITGILLSLVVFGLSMMEGLGYFPAFLLAVSLAVAIVPEGLPAVMTIILSIGVKRMANKNTIIRKLSAIEALGSITLIATDKTGTLTTNKMKVKEIYINNSQFSISNFQQIFNFQLPNIKEDAASLLILNGILCSTASLSYNDKTNNHDVLGDPTEGALLYLIHDRGIDINRVQKEWAIIDEQPFNSVSKTMSVLVVPSRLYDGRHKDETRFLFSKGAPESVLALCDTVVIGKRTKKLSEEQKEKIDEQVNDWAKRGLRVLAFAYKKINKSQISINPNRQNLKTRTLGSLDSNLENCLEFGACNLVFLGLVAIHDAPRPEIVQAVEKAHQAGIKVVMITGDREQTAEAIGIVAGIIHKGDEVVTGYEIDNYSDQELSEILKRVKIFARTNPFQKHRIVQLYQKMGEVVAVTGDGVNDAIALKQADVGVAMGLVGTDVARETADMVITDDNFATIVNAVEEGRNIIQHLKNAIKYLLSCNISEAMTLIVGLIMGLPTLLYPIQLLYINLITDGLPALTLSFSPRNPRVMETAPEKEPTLLKKKEQIYIFAVGIIAAILVLCSYYLYANFLKKSIAFTAVFSILTLVQSFIFVDLWLSHRSLHRNLLLLKSPLFIAAFILPFILQFYVVVTPGISQLFRIEPVSVYTYIQFVVFAGFVFVGIKGVKTVLRI